MKIKKLITSLLVIFVFYTCFQTIAMAQSNKNKWNMKWNNYVSTLLPPPIDKIKIKKTQIKDVQKLLGKASVVENNKHYYEINHFKYALEIVYENNIVSEFSFTFPKKHPSLGEIVFPSNSLTHYPPSQKNSGRYFLYSDKSGDLVIDPIDKTIFSVRFKQ